MPVNTRTHRRPGSPPRRSTVYTSSRVLLRLGSWPGVKRDSVRVDRGEAAASMGACFWLCVAQGASRTCSTDRVPRNDPTAAGAPTLPSCLSLGSLVPFILWRHFWAVLSGLDMAEQEATSHPESCKDIRHLLAFARFEAGPTAIVVSLWLRRLLLLTSSSYTGA